MQTYLDELKSNRFSSTPWASETELEFEGMKVYTSEALKENVKKVSIKYLPKFSGIINKLIDQEKIEPVFMSKNIFDFLIKRKKKLEQAPIARFIYKTKTIFLFLDHNYSLLKLSSVTEKKLASLITHELIHLTSEIYSQKFYSINSKYFIEFYREFFSNYLSVDINKIKNNLIVDIIKNILISKKKGSINFISIYFAVFKALEPYSAIPKDEYQKDIWNEFISYLEEQIYSHNKYVPPRIWEAGRFAYIKVSGGKNETIAQEFWNPDEIISVIAEINPNSPVAINTINLLSNL